MRLGKEEAVGYVEDTADVRGDETETASLATEQIKPVLITAGEPQLATQAAEPPLTVR